MILQVADSLHTRGILCVVYIRFLLASTCAITRIRRWICNCYGKGELLRAEGEACAQQMCLEPLALPTISSSRTAPGRGMSDGGHGVRDERQRKYGCARRRANRDGKEKRKEKKRMRREEKKTGAITHHGTLRSGAAVSTSIIIVGIITTVTFVYFVQSLGRVDDASRTGGQNQWSE